MRIKIIFDKDTLDKNLYTGWGVSFLVDDRILFDTGENGEWLISNMKKLKAGLNKLEAVVASHDHWDHTGGLGELLKRRTGLKVYACPDFSMRFKKTVQNSGAELIENKKCARIAKDIFVTGQITGEYPGQYIPEQALVVKTDNGISVITGCAHPGIVKMLEVIRRNFPGEKFYLVTGGFHLMDTEKKAIGFIVGEFRKMGIKKVGPTHCTGKEAEDIFENEYKKDFIPIKVGGTLEI